MAGELADVGGLRRVVERVAGEEDAVALRRRADGDEASRVGHDEPVDVVADRHGQRAEAVSANPIESGSASLRVTRGVHHSAAPLVLRSERRASDGAAGSSGNLSLRLARTLATGGEKTRP